MIILSCIIGADSDYAWSVGSLQGESTCSKDLIFALRRSSLLQFKTKLDVFLACNTKEDVCDFKIKGSWLERSCIIYAGDTNNIVAQVIKNPQVSARVYAVLINSFDLIIINRY